MNDWLSRSGKPNASVIPRFGVLALAAAILLLMGALAAGCDGPPTGMPTGIPTATPGISGEPTVMPTDPPTVAPTDAPTSVPTEPPTEPPTEAPTAAPTPTPVPSPTPVPTPATETRLAYATAVGLGDGPGGADTVTLDYVEMYTGAEAIAKAKEDGSDIVEIDEFGNEYIPNDYYIRNNNPMLRTFPFDPACQVRMVGLMGPDAMEEVTVAEFREAVLERRRLVQVEIESGIVTDLFEFYTP